MDKCEWKEGKFYQCKDADCRIDFTHGDLCIDISGRGLIMVAFCPFCGADIRKPEPETEVIIKKDGETWVARYDGVDYLWTAQARMNINREKLFVKENRRLNNAFKPISEIEITDEIAKLRPMVVNVDILLKLLYVNRATSVLLQTSEESAVSSVSFCSNDSFSLATIEDLP